MPAHAPTPGSTRVVDRENRKFWDELCGSALARQLGITDNAPESLGRFDRAYLDYYPYLLERVPVDRFRGKEVLEVGLGYGTLSQLIAEAGAIYAGLDIAAGPVMMVNHRLRMRGLPGAAAQGSILDCPFRANGFDAVVSIGCFHHTGNLQRAVDESRRVLRPGGTAYVMVYNGLSYRQWRRWPRQTLARAVGGDARRPGGTESQRQAYDANAEGIAAPETVFPTSRQLRKIFSGFSDVELKMENCDTLSLRGIPLVQRRHLLRVVGGTCGLDIYIRARK